MLEIVETAQFRHWFLSLRDEKARDRIVQRLLRFGAGNFGDVKPIGQGISEARIDYGRGYRLYFFVHGRVVVVMLCGGNKGTQSQDVKQAKILAKEYYDQQKNQS